MMVMMVMMVVVMHVVAAPAGKRHCDASIHEHVLSDGSNPLYTVAISIAMNASILTVLWKELVGDWASGALSILAAMPGLVVPTLFMAPGKTPVLQTNKQNDEAKRKNEWAHSEHPHM